MSGEAAPRSAGARGGRRMPMAVALGVFTVLLTIGYGVDQWTRGRLIEQARGQVDVRLVPYANVFATAMRRRVERLTALKVFVENAKSRKQIETEFPVFAAGLMRGATGVRALELVRDGVIEYVFPIEGNESVQQFDISRDSLSAPARDVRRTMASGEITISSPRPIIQGPVAIIARQRIRTTVPGLPNLAAVVIETDSLLAIVGILGGVPKLDVVVRDKSGAVVWPTAAVTLVDPLLEPIVAADGNWSLEGAPIGGWDSTVSGTLDVLRGTWLVIALLIAGVAFLVTDRQSRLTSSVLERTRELERANLDLRREVGEREQAEAALRRHEEQMLQSQKMQAVGTLAGGIAHDFNNVLTAIIGFSRLADSRTEDLMKSASSVGPALQGVRDDVQEVLRAAEHAAVITNQLLAFSRKQDEPPGALDLSEALRDFEPLLRRLLGERVRLVTEVAPTLPSVFADKGQITQVLVNLAVNARDAMPAGGQLWITAAESRVEEGTDVTEGSIAEGHYVELVVRDTGTGMPADVRARAFEPFFTTKGLGKGTGLGLATVYAIVTRAGGRVVIESETGQGTTVRVLLAVTERPTAVPANEPATESGASHQETILVAEDEPSVRNIVDRVLTRRGYKVLLAASGEAALKVVEDGATFDMLLTDMVMPGISGAVLAERVLALRPGLPVLFMSGYSEESRQFDELHEGRATLLAKPFSPDDLVREVRAVLDRH